VGKIKDAHGIRGELYVLVFSGEVSWLNQLKQLDLYSAGRTEWFQLAIERVRPHKQGFIAKCTELSDRNQAEELKGCEFFIPETFLVSQPGQAIYLAEIDGFRVIQKGLGEVGRIVGFSGNGAQDLLLVENPRGQFAVPFVKELVVAIRYAEQEIEMDLPEGLVE
jgi:16S rRNA processing protein RimM